MALKPEGASQAAGAKSWQVRTGRNLRDHVRDLLFCRRKLRSSRLGAGSELEPVPVLFPQLHCLPGCVASFTLNRGKADPSEKGRGNPQAGTWVLTMNDL